MRGDSVSCSFGVCCLALLIASPAVDARADQPDEGIVLGQTVTVAGQDFFQYFVSLWRDKRISERVLITVRERPSARNGSMIWIEHQGHRLLQFALPASRGGIRGLSEQAAEQLGQRLTQAEIDSALDHDIDLARDAW